MASNIGTQPNPTTSATTPVAVVVLRREIIGRKNNIMNTPSILTPVTSVAELRAQYERAASSLRHHEALGASRHLSHAENRDYRIAEAEHRSALEALEAAAAGLRATDSSLALALANSTDMEPGTSRSVSFRDMEVRGTDPLLKSTPEHGGNLVEDSTTIVGPDIFTSYREHRDLLRFVPEETVTIRGDGFQLPRLTTGVATKVAGEADAYNTVADATFDRLQITWDRTSTRSDISHELLEDGAYNLERLIIEEHGKAGVRAVETSAVTSFVADAGVAINAAPVTLTPFLDAAGGTEAAGHSPSVAVISPVDWLTLRKANSNALGSARMFTESTGLELVLSSALATGTALVLDPSAVKVFRRSLLPVTVIRSGAGFATDTVSVVSHWRYSADVLAADGAAVIVVV